jgi:hypothetical protein
MNETSQAKGGIASGFFLGIGLCIVQALLTWVIVLISKSLGVIIFGLYFYGLIQLVYVVPLYLFLRKRKPATATGLAIAAGLVILVNATCAALVR